jgi:hypothetical protein
MHYTNFKLQRKSINWIQCLWISQFLKGSISADCCRDLHKPWSTNNRLGPLFVSSHNVRLCSTSGPSRRRTEHRENRDDPSFGASFMCIWAPRHQHQMTRCRPSWGIIAWCGWVDAIMLFEPIIGLRPQATPVVRPWLFCVLYVLWSKVETTDNVTHYLCM